MMIVRLSRESKNRSVVKAAGFCMLSLLMFLIALPAAPQITQGIIRGMVTGIAAAPVAGASVELLTDDTLMKGVATDSSGYFMFQNLTPGRYSIRIKHIGYQNLMLYNLLVVSGKELVVEAQLNHRTHLLREVKIRGNSTINPSEVNPLSARVVNLEETMRYAATFNDPVRVMASYPEVIVTNDQANHVAIRGNSPAGLQWKIEGADVVNPNHLTNAGTLSDRPTLTGGGVAIISSQLLSEALFLSGTFPVDYGNVLSGVFDYKLRKGNSKEYEYTAQASVLGLDFAAEGPFSANSNQSFLANFRYSTLGLFELAGIPIGDEKINFSDLSINISLPSEKAGDFTLFGIGGKSITSFRAQSDSSAWEVEKDRTNYDFNSEMGVVGVTHRIAAGSSAGIFTSLAVSYLRNSRSEYRLSDDYTALFNGSDRLDAGKISLSTRYEKSYKNGSFHVGVNINNDEIRFGYKTGLSEKWNTEIDYKEQYQSIQPFVSISYSAGNINFEPGLHVHYISFNREVSVEPRASVKWQINEYSRLSAAYGLHSMVQHPSVYFNRNSSGNMPGLTKAHHIGMGYMHWINPTLVLNAELFYQRLFNVPVNSDSPDSFSALNIIETTTHIPPLENTGTGKNYGIEATLQQNTGGGLYYIIAGSLYNSRYKGSDGIERDTRFNGKYHAKLTIGKEFHTDREKKLNTFGVNLSAVYAGGMRYTPIDLDASIAMSTTIYQEEKAYSEKFNDYFRIDTRFTWRIDKKSLTRTIFLDIQNLTNHENTGWLYFDRLTGSVITKYQLGIIPFMGYRIEF